MKPHKTPLPYLEHIVKAVDRINNFSKCGREIFLKQDMEYFAILQNLQNLCESCSRLPETIKNSHKEVDWKKIKDFRNILVHDYMDQIDLNIVWDVIVNKISQLKDMALKELPNYANE